MKRLLKLTAIIETVTGLGLLAVPSVVVRLLLGSPLGTSAAVMLARIAGAALVALGVAGIGLGLHGVVLWPAVVLHAAMAVWCIGCLRRNSSDDGDCMPLHRT